MSKKPGVMIYFDMRESLNRMSDQKAGQLFRVILEYGETGREPTIPDGLLLIWPLIRMRLDCDHMRYEQTSLKRRYANYVKNANKDGTEKLSYEQWLANQYDTDAEQLQCM